jgi:hypothetical protein
MGSKTLPTIWYTYMTLVTKYQISAIHICTFFITFFSATVDGRNLIFGHKLHIGTHIVGSVFGPIRFLLPVCRFVDFYTHLTYTTKFGTSIKIRLNRKFESTEFETMRVNCMFNVYKNQLSWQTGSRNLTGPKTLPTIWHTYIKFVTKYQIPVINNSLSQIYLSKHVYYLRIKIGSQVKHLVIEFDIFTLGYFTCLFHNLSN